MNSQKLAAVAARVSLALAATLAILPFDAARLRSQSTATAPGVPSAGQQQAQANPPSASLRVTTRLIQVNVVVHDKHGNPINGLTKDDFHILDERQPQTIQVFSVHTNLPADHSAGALPPDTFTNRLEQTSQTPKSVTVILLDGLNSEIHDQEYARKQVLKFLAQLEPQDRVGLYTLGRELRILHDFTTDSSALIASLHNYRGQQTPELAGSRPEMPPERPAQLLNPKQDIFQGLFDRANQHVENFYLQSRVRMTVGALEAIANHVSGLPGRKNLVWVSGSFPIAVGFDDLQNTNRMTDSEKLTFWNEIEKAARALNEANMAVYPIDARGLFGYDMNAARPANLQSGFATRRGMNSRTQIVAPDTSEINTMIMLADRTGGKAYYNSNDIFGSVRKAIDDSKITYELAYYATNTKWDGKFHEIKVTVNQPGVQVRARKGYFAVPDPKVTPKDIKEILSDAAISPIEATGIGLTVHPRAADVPGAERLSPTIHFDLHEISMEQKDGRWVGTIDAIYVQLDREGKILGAFDDKIELDLPPARHEQLLKTGVSYTRDVPIQPGAVEFRVVLRDNATGAVGSVVIPLKSFFASANAAN